MCDFSDIKHWSFFKFQNYCAISNNVMHFLLRNILIWNVSTRGGDGPPTVTHRGSSRHKHTNNECTSVEVSFQNLDCFVFQFSLLWSLHRLLDGVELSDTGLFITTRRIYIESAFGRGHEIIIPHSTVYCQLCFLQPDLSWKYNST